MPGKLLKNTADFIARNNLLSPGNSPVIVGLSGGPDSVALLSALQKLGYNCIAAHANFHLRSEESDRDELFVRSLCKELQIELHTIDFQTVEFSKKEGISIEMAARKLRYEWFEKLAVDTGAQAIAVGHHLDDNLETVLLNLIRGTGLRGLTGMPLRNGKVIRPFLGSSRSEIMQFIEEEKLNFVTDSTNASTDIMRNKIRHEVLPMLESINPAFRNKLSETRNHLSQTSNLIANFIENWKSTGYFNNGNEIKLDISRISAFPEPGLLLFELLSPLGFNSAQISDVTGMLQKNAGRKVLSESHVLLKDRDYLIIKSGRDENNADTWQVLPNQISDNPPELKISLFDKHANFEFSKSKKLIHLDAEKLLFPLILRRTKPGDFFFPQGMKMQKKKLSDFLIDAKLSLFEKENLWILESEGQIAWVIGYRIDERFRVTTDTKKIAEITIKS